MEILNNIWTALMMPNEELMKLFLIPLSFIEIPLVMYLFIYALGISATKKQKLLFIISMVTVSILNIFVIPTPFNVIFNYLSTFILAHVIFKLNLLKSLIAMIIPTVIFALLNVLLLSPFVTLLNITREESTSVPIYRILYLFILYSMIFIINLTLKYKNITISILDVLDKKSKLILFTNLFFGLIAVISQLIISFYYLTVLPILISFISFISLFAYFAISIYSLTRATKLALTTQELQSAEAYNKSLSILHDNVRGFKHDFDNIVATIGGYVKTDDMEGLKNYYYQLEDDCQRVNNIAALNPILINNPGIFNLLSSKYHEADSKNITINLEVFLDLNTLNIKIYEFSRILGILLDNAIEEAEKCDERVINIKFRNESNKNRNIIIIENTYTNKDVDIKEIFNKGISGKNNHSGLGLWEVKQILKKNSNLNLYTTKNDKFFKQQLEIYYK